MILLIGIDSDEVINYYRDYLIFRNIPHLFYNQNRAGNDIHIRMNSIVFQDKIFRSEEFTGALNRMVVANTTHSQFDYHERMNQCLLAWLDENMKNLVNRPVNTLSNSSKPYQLNLYSLKHLRIPSTSIYRGQVKRSTESSLIYKSISSIRSIVNELPSSSNDFNIPTLCQEKIDGINIRVHIVGTSIFAMQITSDQIDYRYATSALFKGITLPDHIAADCFEIARQNQFSFVGIDLIYVGQNYYFLEANPSPGYSYFEKHLDCPDISTALTALLRGEQK